MKFVSIAGWTSALALVSACTTSPDTELPYDGTGGALTGGSAGTSAGTAGTNMMAGMGGSAGVGGASGGSAGAGGATSGAGGGGGIGDAGTGGGAGKGGNGGAGSGGTAAGMAGTGNGGSGGAQAGAGAGGMSGMSGMSGAGGAGAANGGAGAGGKGGAGAGSGGLAGTGGTGVLMELANDRPATADSEENSSNVHLAADGNDGMSDTRWCAANGDPHYWQVDLGAVHPLQRIEIDFEYPPQADGASYGYVVTVSSDGTTFSPGIDRSTNTSTSATQTAMFPANTSGRHVRVLITPPATTPSATWASFWEARIFGY
jgi:hypothetical protein